MPLLFTTALLLAQGVAPATQEGPAGFLATYCVQCHGPDGEREDLRFDGLGAPDAGDADRALWSEILAEVRELRMPPEDATQPTADQRATFLTWAEGLLGPAHHGKRPTRRRLSHRELRYTYEDLFHLAPGTSDPTLGLPEEGFPGGFDNDGRGLVMSEQFLTACLEVARNTVEAVTHFEPQPVPQTWSMTGPFHRPGWLLPEEWLAQHEQTKLRWSDPRRHYVCDRYRPYREDPWTDLLGEGYRGGAAPFLPLMDGVKTGGRYTLRVKASALHRVHDFEWIGLVYRQGSPLELQLYAVRHRDEGDREYLIGAVDVLDEEPQWFEFQGYLEQGYEPEVRLGNVRTSVKRIVRRLARRSTEQQPEFWELRDENFYDPEVSAEVLSRYKGPTLRIHEIEVTGPELAEWPPAGHRRLYGRLGPGVMTLADALELLRSFCDEAFRRPVRDDEFAVLAEVVTKAADDRQGIVPALQLGLQMALCSPPFLFLDQASTPLAGHALASRLSYFLYSSLPDEPLRQRADRGELGDPEVLAAEVRRMLADERSRRFEGAFLDNWLDLHGIEGTPPTPDFRVYHRDSIDRHMRTESALFLRDVLDRNGSVLELIRSDHTFVNRPLAAFYKLDPVDGLDLRKVELPAHQRGGLLGQASLLTASANGVDTSPVVRGAYLLRRFFGRPPSPPPPGVPALEPDASGAISVRDQLKRHMADPSCATCHDKIDPPGFALETFDAVGQVRRKYPDGQDIDARALPSTGAPFEGLDGLQERLIGESDEFRRCLTRMLLQHALGRELDAQDEPDVQHIVKELREKGDGLRDLITLVVLSPTFRGL